MRHFPALDGLRGLALTGVLLFHANQVLVGGYLGVDLFFVLSGFLITALLVAEHGKSGRVDLAAFWVRRARRLFPALLSLLAGVAVYCWLFAAPNELRGIRNDALATLGYVANWRASFAEKTYWEMFVAPSPLDHTWSLSIEEQFYVVWPVVALFALRGGRRALFRLSMGLALASMLAMIVHSNAETSTRAYMGTDTRAAAILAGAMLALWATPEQWAAIRSTRLLDLVGGLAALAIAVAWWSLDGESPLLYRGGFWITEACALPLVVCALAGSRSLVGRALAFPPLAWLGTISYGAYLWHWPVDVVLDENRTHLHGAPLHALQIGVTLAIATASHRWLERPIRTRGVPFGKPLIVLPAAVGVVLVALLAATHERKALASAALVPPPRDADGGVTFRVVLLGDSTANSLADAIRGLREPGVLVEPRGVPGCAMLRDGCGSLSWKDWTREAKPDVTLVFLGGAFEDQAGGYRPACGEWSDRLRKRIAQRARGLTRVFVVTVPHPVGHYDTPPLRELTDCINASIREAASDVPDTGVIDLAEHLCPKGECAREHDGAVIRPDGVHFDARGARGVARWVLAQAR